MAILKFSELSWQDKQIAAINRLSKAKGWSFGDNNPYFERVWNVIHNKNIKTKKQMKEECKKMDIDKFKSVAVRKPDYELLKGLCNEKFRSPASMISKLVNDYVEYQAKKKNISLEKYVKEVLNVQSNGRGDKKVRRKSKRSH